MAVMVRERESSETPDAVTTTSPTEALRQVRARHLLLKGTLERNQGRLTFTGRLSLDQLVETTTVHNRAWSEATDIEGAEELVMQREIQSSHAVSLTYFLLQGLADATMRRMQEDGMEIPPALRTIWERLSPPSSAAIPPVTLVLAETPDVTTDRVGNTSLALSAGTLFLVADGQHRRDGARRLRDLFMEVIGTGTIPRSAAVLGLEPGPITDAQIEAFVALQDTFRSWSFIAYEAHLGLTVKEMRQLFINYNYHAQPVSADLSLSFDESHPLNVFNKVLQHKLLAARPPLEISLRQLATITGLAVMGRPNMRRTPRDVEEAIAAADMFWSLVRNAKDFRREQSLLRAIPILKGLAKAFWVTHRAPERYRAEPSSKRTLRMLVKTTTFDKTWLAAVPGMKDLVRSQSDGSFKFAPTHNEIVAKLVAFVV